MTQKEQHPRRKAFFRSAAYSMTLLVFTTVLAAGLAFRRLGMDLALNISVTALYVLLFLVLILAIWYLCDKTLRLPYDSFLYSTRDYVTFFWVICYLLERAIHSGFWYDVVTCFFVASAVAGIVCAAVGLHKTNVCFLKKK